MERTASAHQALNKLSMKGKVNMIELNYPELDNILKAVLDEDIGAGDITTIACIPETAESKGAFIAKEPGVISGLSVIKRVFELLDETVNVTLLVTDGDTVEAGDIIAKISGSSRAILSGERTALNLLQHMSGIATKTAKAVNEISGTKAKILDTRKTTPGMRALDKYAVRCGGGTNHRFSLADGILIKDNHIKAAGSISNAIRQTIRAQNEKQVKIKVTNDSFSPSPKMLVEVEAETLEQVKEALDAGAEIIMLDNMSPEMMKEAVKMISHHGLTEASGNMGDRDLSMIAKTGVDFISIGALTHSVKALDISLKFE